MITQKQIPVRRACHCMNVSPSLLYYQKKPDRNLRLKERIKEKARAGIGYRMIHADLKSEFEPLNIKRVHRLWKEIRPPARAKRKHIRSGKTVPMAATAPGEVWCIDFAYDCCENEEKLKILAIKDEFTRECLALVSGPRMPAKAVVEVLKQLTQTREAPKYLRSDNGPEFISQELKDALKAECSQSYFIDPGSPWQNGHAESFVSRLRAELLDAEVFYNQADATIKLERFRRFYNEERPHSAIGYIPPSQYAASLTQHIREAT